MKNSQLVIVIIRVHTVFSQFHCDFVTVAATWRRAHNGIIQKWRARCRLWVRENLTT